MDDTIETVPVTPLDIASSVVQPTTQTAARSDPAAQALVWIIRITIGILFIALAVFIWREGVQLRHWVWDTTVPIRYTGDIDRDYRWGRLAAKEGYLNQYEKMQDQKPDDGDWLDQPPLRLAVMTLWGKWSVQHFPKVDKWSSDHSYGLTAPMLRLDLSMEALAVIAAFGLTRYWALLDRTITPVLKYGQESSSALTTSFGASAYIRTAVDEKEKLRWLFRGCIPALIAVLLLWFNPAVIVSAYACPTWDLWLIPMFLMAALLASYECWFSAGIVVGIGTMLNEHMALSIPLFLLWSIILHGWPKWPLPALHTSVISICTVLLFVLINLLATSFDLVSTIVLLLAEAGMLVLLLVGWSLVWRPLCPLRFLSGLVIAIALIASPWLLSYIPADRLAVARAVQSTFGEPAKVPVGIFQIPRSTDVPAVMWVLGVLVSAAGLPWVAWLTLERPAIGGNAIPRWRHVLASQWAWRGFAALGAFVLVLWPWWIQRNHSDWPMGLVATVAMIAAIQLIRPRGIAVLAIASVGTALLLCMSVFHGSTAWYDCGFHFQTIHWPWMARGMADNLPAIMVRDFNWHRLDLKETAFTIPAHFVLRHPTEAVSVSVGAALNGLFWVALLLCSLGAAMHARLRGSRMLVAQSAIWLMYFCFPPQIHEHYLVFAAGISCICVGTSVGMTLLGLFLSVSASVMMLNNLLATASESGQLGPFSKGLAEQFPKLFSNRSGGEILRALNGANPDLGYAIVLCGLVFLYFSLAPQLKFEQTKTPLR